MSTAVVEQRNSFTRDLSPQPACSGGATKRSKRGSNSWCRTDDGVWVPEEQVPAARPVERPRVDSSAPLSKLVRTMSLEMPPPPAPAPVSVPAPMPVEPPPLPAACAGLVVAFTHSTHDSIRLYPTPQDEPRSPERSGCCPPPPVAYQSVYQATSLLYICMHTDLPK